MALALAVQPRVGIYARVSQDKRDRRSVNQQIEESEEWCDDEGWIVEERWIDNDTSASRYSKKQRPNWELVKEAIRAHRIDMLMMWETSRATRKLDGFTELRDLCEKHHVLLAYSGDVYDMSNPKDRQRAATDSINAEYESELTSQRVKRDRRKMAKKGTPAGRIPFGYRNAFDPATGAKVGRVPDEVNAPLVREAASRFLNGESLFSIAKDWNARGIPTAFQPKEDSRASKLGASRYGWQSDSVRRILRNPAINNLYLHRGSIVGRGTWEPIIDDATWAKMESKFNDPTRATYRASTEPKLLTGGILRCGACGGRMIYAPKGKGSAASGKARKLYRCAYGKASDGRNHVSRDMDQLDTYIEDIILTRAVNGQLGSADDGTDNVGEVREAVDALRGKIRETAQKVLSDEIDAEYGDILQNGYRDKIRELERSIKVVNVPENVRAFADADDPYDYWAKLSVEERREIIGSEMVIVVHRSNRIGSKVFDPDAIEIRKP